MLIRPRTAIRQIRVTAVNNGTHTKYFFNPSDTDVYFNAYVPRGVIPTQPEQKSAEGRFLEGKLLCEKSHAKISGKKGRRLTEGFSI